jgi:hypothetical protein
VDGLDGPSLSCKPFCRNEAPVLGGLSLSCVGAGFCFVAPLDFCGVCVISAPDGSSESRGRVRCGVAAALSESPRPCEPFGNGVAIAFDAPPPSS